MTTTSTRSYYGQPVLKRPVWTREIPLYLFAGGLAGASAGVAFLAGTRGDPLLARRAWIVASAGIAASPPLLISDLGRPERFANMLRLFKVTSPMSVGSWILSVSGASTSLAALNAVTGRWRRPAVVARPTAALFGLGLSTYTAALLTNTAVPVWHEARDTLPFVFASGAALSAGGACAAATPVRPRGRSAPPGSGRRHLRTRRDRRDGAAVGDAPRGLPWRPGCRLRACGPSQRSGRGRTHGLAGRPQPSHSGHRRSDHVRRRSRHPAECLRGRDSVGRRSSLRH